MITNEQLKSFLKEYAAELRSDFDWSYGAPYMARTQMAAGYCQVVDALGETIAVFITKGTHPPMPISARDVQGSQLLANILNLLSKHSESKGEPE